MPNTHLPVTNYPQYGIDFDSVTMDRIAAMAERLLVETGLEVPCDPFVERIKGKKGFTFSGKRLCLDRDLVKAHIQEYRDRSAKRYQELAGNGAGAKPPAAWTISSGGFSLDVIDLDTDAIRPATTKDLAALTRLADSYDMGGPNIVQPQDVPPIMRDIAACRGSFENGRNFITSCHSHQDQTPYLLDMFKVVAKPFPALIITAPPLRVAPENLEEFLYLYDNHWDDIESKRVVISPMIYNAPGISGPITVAGNMALAFAESVGAHILLDIFDERINLPIAAGGSGPTDLRYANYAFGSPRTHVFAYLAARWGERFAGYVNNAYQVRNVQLWTSSCRQDEQAGLEKMACALTGALQGARAFGGAGNLCVDDLFSGVQLVLDVEIVNYIRELVESFRPDEAITSMEGIYEAILDVVHEKDMFLSHETTLNAFRKTTPSSDIFHREKLRSWLAHPKDARDRAREIARERIRAHDFRLADARLQALEKIYAVAEKKLLAN